MKPIWRPQIAFIGLLAVVLAACSHAHTKSVVSDVGKDPEAPKFDNVECVAVFPFDNLTQYPQAGRIMSDLMSTMFYRSGKFRLMERGELERIAELSKVKLPAKIPPRFARTLGEALEVDAVLFGSVTEYAYLDPSTGNPGVSVNVTLLDVASGKPLWVATHSRVSTDVFLYKKDPVNRVGLLAAEAVTAPLFSQLPKRGVDFSVVCGNAEAIIAPFGEASEEPLFSRNGSLTGRTVQKNGTALGNVTLEIPERGLSRLLTDGETGTFRLENLEPGKVKIIASKEGYVTDTFDAMIEPGKVAMLDLQMKESKVKEAVKQGTLTGKVLDTKGQPIQASIFMKAKGQDIDLKTESAADGKFTMKVYPGDYQVRIIAKGFISQQKNVKVESKGKIILNVNLHPEREL